MREFVRLTLKCIETENGESYFSKAMIDLVINLETRKAVASDVMYGALGTHDDDPQNVYPFILEPNGTIDFGSWGENENRDGNTNIYDKQITKGESVTIQDEEGLIHICKIVHLHIMGQSLHESNIRLGLI